MLDSSRFIRILQGNFMDVSGEDKRANILPPSCPHCTFPDLDQFPNPYLLSKGIDSPSELGEVASGNFVVRPRAQAILQHVIPGQLEFLPTAHFKTRLPTPWSLAVPKLKIKTHNIKPTVRLCTLCGEPEAAHASRYISTVPLGMIDADVYYTRDWTSSEKTYEDSHNRWARAFAKDQVINFPEHQWTRLNISRNHFLSIRLVTLLKQLEIGKWTSSSLYYDKPITPDSADLQWVNEKIASLPPEFLQPQPSSSKVSHTWFDKHVSSGKSKLKSPLVFSQPESRWNFALPESYKAYITKRAGHVYKDVDEQEGFNVSIYTPDQLETLISFEPNEAFGPDPIFIAFCDNGHGDQFVFHVNTKPKNTEYPIYYYDHETNSLEHYANTFPECIKQFAGKP
jgi:hypothetical protein